MCCCIHRTFFLSGNTRQNIPLFLFILLEDTRKVVAYPAYFFYPEKDRMQLLRREECSKLPVQGEPINAVSEGNILYCQSKGIDQNNLVAVSPSWFSAC